MKFLKNRKAKVNLALVLAISIIVLQFTNTFVLAASSTDNGIESTEIESVESTEVPTETIQTEDSTESISDTENSETSTEESTETESTEVTDSEAENTEISDTETESTEIQNTEIENTDETSEQIENPETSSEESTQTSTNLPPKGTYDTNFTTKWSTPLTHLSSTTSGIDISFETINGIDTIIYTIPNSFTGTEININAVEDTKNIKGSSYVPGNLNSFAIKFVNNSNYAFSYVSGSFILTTEDLSKYSNFIANAVGFDGSPIAYDYAGYRTVNIAIKSLYGTDLSVDMLSDEKLGNKLIEAGYSNGIADLDKYYLDYYNNFMGTSVGRLENFSDDVVVLILTGTNSGIKETNKQVAELAYNWFYNRMLSVIPSGVSEDSTYDYTVGSYMRNPSLYETYCQTAFSNLISNSESTLNPIKLYSNVKAPISTYTGLSFGYLMGMKLSRPSDEPTPEPQPDPEPEPEPEPQPEPEYGSIQIVKIDESSNKITSSSAEFMLYKFDENKSILYYNGSDFVSSEKDAKVLSTKDGVVTVNNLQPGTYFVKETKAPEGYNLDSSEHQLEISGNSTFTLKVTNTKTPEETITPDKPNIVTQIINAIPPKTGDNGITICKVIKYITLLLTGILIILVASLEMEYQHILTMDVKKSKEKLN